MKETSMFCSFMSSYLRMDNSTRNGVTAMRLTILGINQRSLKRLDTPYCLRIARIV